MNILFPSFYDSIGNRGNFWQLLTEATTAALPATKTLPWKPNTGGGKYEDCCNQADKKILICIESPWKTLKVIVLQEGSVMGHLQTAHGVFFISDLRL